MTDMETHTDTPPAAAIPAPAAKHKRTAWAVAAVVLTLAAWIAGSLSGVAALIISALAIVAGVAALRSPSSAVRNTAITAIIASAVLLVVVGAFMIVVYLGLKTI